MIVFVSILAFLLDGILSKYLTSSSLFIPLFTVMSLIIIYPYFQIKYKYFRYSMILGLLYDIAYTNTIFYNFFIFILLCLIISFFYYIFSNTLYITFFISIIIVFVYRLIDIIFLLIFKNNNINFTLFIKSIYSSLILNVLFCIIGYIFTNIYSKKKNILRIS